MRPPGGSEGPGRSSAVQSAASAAWKLAVVCGARRSVLLTRRVCPRLSTRSRLLDPDRLLYFFRQRAGLPPPTRTPRKWPGVPDTHKPPVPYGGWESAGHVLRGEFVGHYLMAASYALRHRGSNHVDPRARAAAYP